MTKVMLEITLVMWWMIGGVTLAMWGVTRVVSRRGGVKANVMISSNVGRCRVL
jgi:hypothetical protein